MSAQMIDHQEAVKNLMAERYLLGELNAGEREAYEEHLFSCNACFEQVKAGTEFVGHLRRIGTEEADVQPSWSQLIHRAFRPSAALAFAIMFLCVAGISARQAMIIHQMKAPESVIVVTVPPPARAADNPIIAPRQGNFELRAVFQPSAKLQSYRARIVAASGKEIASVAIKKPETAAVQVRLNAGSFREGDYILIVQAIDQTTGSTQVIEQRPFKLQLQD
jgi:anti-sigma factor RsiW